MITDLFLQLEQKVEFAVDTIELLKLQIEELEEENLALKAEHEKWRNDLSALISRLDQVNLREVVDPNSHMTEVEEEESEYEAV